MSVNYKTKCDLWLESHCDEKPNYPDENECSFLDFDATNSHKMTSSQSSSKSSSSKNPTSEKTIWLKYLKNLCNATISEYAMYVLPTKKIALDYFVEFQRAQSAYFENTNSGNTNFPKDEYSDELTRQNWNLQITALFNTLIAQSQLFALPDKKKRYDLMDAIKKINEKAANELKLLASEKQTVSSIIALTAGSSGSVYRVREPPGCSRPDGKRPDGLSLVPWVKGKSLLWDYTCADTFAKSYVDRTSREPGYAAKHAEDIKYEHYKDLMDQFIFVPIATETSGIFGTVGLQLIKKIGNKIKTVTNENRATSYLIQRIAVAIQRGNVVSILGTIPRSKNLGEIYYL